MQTKYTKTPEGNDLVRLFNNTLGSFIHEITLADGVTKVKYTLPGMTFAKVPREVAAHWLKAFPQRVVTDTEAHESANASRAELEGANKRIADLEAELAAAKAGKGEKPKVDSKGGKSSSKDADAV